MGAFACAEVNGVSKGRFLTELDLRDVNGRDFELLGEFKYQDPKDVIWIVPKGTTVNGASIPRVLWGLVGGPWSGKYRRASVIHDYFFDRIKYGSESIHRVFYDAMLTSGVSSFQAKTMYYAVLRFNDRWEKIGQDPYHCIRGPRGRNPIRCYPELAGEPKSYTIQYQRVEVKFDKDELDLVKNRIETERMPVAVLENLANENYVRSKK